jgi:hypothetical protein
VFSAVRGRLAARLPCVSGPRNLRQHPFRSSPGPWVINKRFTKVRQEARSKAPKTTAFRLCLRIDPIRALATPSQRARSGRVTRTHSSEFNGEFRPSSRWYSDRRTGPVGRGQAVDAKMRYCSLEYFYAGQPS